MLRTAWRVFRAGFAGWWNDNLSRLGASLAYYTLFAIAPVLVIAIGIAGLAFGPEAVRGEIVHQVDDLIGMEGGRAVQALLKGASNHSAGVLATVIGSITFLLTATGAFLELQYALNTIWRVKPKASSRLRDFLMQRLVSFGIVVAIGFLLLVSLAVSAALAALSGWLNASVPGIATVWIGVNLIISVAVITLLFALLYKVLPDVDLDWRDVWIGALITACLFSVGKTLIGLYIGHSSAASSYGAAGSVVILLLWVYYSAQVVLIGAEMTRAYTAARKGAPKPVGYARRAKRAGVEKGVAETKPVD